MPFSSPTTTSAVNEKRRPPLTTLATRLMSTTRSLSSFASVVLSLATGFPISSLENEPALAGALGERLHTPVVQVAGPVEDDRVDVLGPRALGEQLADLLGHPATCPGRAPSTSVERAAAIVMPDMSSMICA